MEPTLIYGAYVAAGLVALAAWWALPKGGRPGQRGGIVVFTALALGGLVLLLGRVLGEYGGRWYFTVLSLLAVWAALRVVTHPRPVYSALYFLLVVLSTAALVLMAGAEFLAAALVIVYAGAILVTYVFVIMMAQQSAAEEGSSRFGAAFDYDRSAREPAAAVLAGFVLVATVAGVILIRESAPRAAAVEAAPQGNTMALARALFTEHGFPVSLQVAGVLLMVAMVGAIVLAQKRLPRVDEDRQAPPPGEIGRQAPPY